MITLLESLRHSGWTVRTLAQPAELLPEPLAKRYPRLPGQLVSFLSTLKVCHNSAKDSWFLSAADYHRKKSAGFRWNEFELMALDSMSDDSRECLSIKTFWDQHFPFMMAVHSDYDYLAVRLGKKDSGAVVHGFAPDWEEPSIVAPSFTAFAKALAEAGTASEPKYPLGVFL